MNITQKPGYVWIPAGLEKGLFYVRVGVRFKRSDRRFDPFKPFSMQHSWRSECVQLYDLPDRELHIDTSPQGHLEAKNFDYFADLAPFSKDGAVNQACGEWVMCSAKYGLDKQVYERYTQVGGLKLLGDSGGYQLKVRKSDYIDPHKVIAWMNATCDAGLALDIPPAPEIDWGSLAAIQDLAPRQRDNNLIYADKAREDLYLLNIVQGSLPKHSRLWIDTVMHPRFKGWGVSCNNLQDQFSGALRSALILLKEYGEQDWIHFLGLSGPSMFPVMAWLGNHYKITSDSSSQISGIKYRNYMRLTSEGHMLSSLQVSNDPKVCDLPGLNGHALPCSCPVCTAVGYFDVFMDDNTTLGQLILWHDFFVLRRYSHTWNTLALTLTKGEYRELVRSLFGNTTARAIDFIDHALDVGIDRASREFPDLVGRDWSKESFEREIEVAKGSNRELQYDYMTPDKFAALSEDEKAEWRQKEELTGLASYTKAIKARRHRF